MKTYELGINENYQPNWGIQEGIREIVQNTIDSNTNGYMAKVNVNSSHIEFINVGAKLTTENLTLGGGTKANDKSIGQFGEGFKLACLALVRKGIEITIQNGDRIWTPVIRQSETFDGKTLQFDEELSGENYDLNFIVEGIESAVLEELYHDLPALETLVKGLSLSDYEDVEYGFLKLEPEDKGNISVGGIKIMRDEDLSIGFDFKPGILELDRDRRGVNYSDLKGAIESIMEEHEKEYFNDKEKEENYINIHAAKTTNSFKETFKETLVEEKIDVSYVNDEVKEKIVDKIFKINLFKKYDTTKTYYFNKNVEITKVFNENKSDFVKVKEKVMDKLEEMYIGIDPNRYLKNAMYELSDMKEEKIKNSRDVRFVKKSSVIKKIKVINKLKSDEVKVKKLKLIIKSIIVDRNNIVDAEALEMINVIFGKNNE